MDADPFPISTSITTRTLEGLVHRIGAYDVKAIDPAGDREVASFGVPIIISFADPFRIAFDRRPTLDERIGSFVSGLHPGYVDIAYGGPISCLQIYLTPLRARLFFGRASKLPCGGAAAQRNAAGLELTKTGP